MPANHNIPHTAEARAKMRKSHLGTAAPWKHRPSNECAEAIRALKENKE